MAAFIAASRSYSAFISFVARCCIIRPPRLRAWLAGDAAAALAGSRLIRGLVSLSRHLCRMFNATLATRSSRAASLRRKARLISRSPGCHALALLARGNNAHPLATSRKRYARAAARARRWRWQALYVRCSASQNIALYGELLRRANIAPVTFICILLLKSGIISAAVCSGRHPP